MPRIEISAVDMMKHQRHMDRYQSFTGRARPIRAASESVVDMCLDGQPIVYNVPLVKDGEIWVFEPGCFQSSLNGSEPIYFQIDHDQSQRVASTENGVTFLDTPDQLMVRLDLEDADRAREIRQMVESGQRACMSVGIRHDQEHVKMYGKHEVRVITKAKLLEVSIVRDGACRQAFASTVNRNYAPRLVSKGTSFKLGFAAHNLRRVKKTVDQRREDVLAIAAKLDRAERNAPRQDDAQPDMACHFKFY